MVSHNIAPMFEVRNVDTAASTKVIEQFIVFREISDFKMFFTKTWIET